MIDLNAIRGVVSDMDGVLWRGEQALPGLIDFVTFLVGKKISLAFATNNSGKSEDEYVAKLKRFGVEGVEAGQIITSRSATQDYLRHHYQPGDRFYCIGSTGLIAAIEATGMVFDERSARVVVVGIDTELTYRKLTIASNLLLGGAAFIGTNSDRVIPHGDGFVPGNGSILAALTAVSGREPLVIGKPGRPMFEAALRRLGTAPAETLMLGDRLDTDIAGAAAMGMATGLMLTGVAGESDLAAWSGSRPAAIYRDLIHLRSSWEH